MLIDALVSFIPVGSPLSLVGGAGVAIPSNVIDLLGLGVGIAPSTADIIGTATTWGTDLGIGELKAQIEVLITTALTTGSGALLTTAFQLAPEDATTHLPGAWTTIIDQPAVAIANLGAGKRVARFDYPPVIPETLRPRFARLLFSPGAGASFTAGAVIAPVTMQRDDWAEAQQPRNYSVKRPNGT
jgi:hypothetical protein